MESDSRKRSSGDRIGAGDGVRGIVKSNQGKVGSVLELKGNGRMQVRWDDGEVASVFVTNVEKMDASAKK